jgi:tetratricopeptide (TPR) repeat protein
VGIGLSARDPEKALEYFERAGASGADHPGYHNNFGLLLERLGDYARAKSEFKNAVAAAPGNAVYRRNLALLYMKSGQPVLAVPIWEALHQEQPDDRSCKIYLGRAYLELGRFDAAVGILEKWLDAAAASAPEKLQAPGAATGAPGLDEAYAVLAMSFRGMKRLDRAAVYMRKALDLYPDNVAHLINYGVVLAEDGKIAEAKVQWEEALRIDPENATARRNLSAYQR